jgi:hypothetical protein
LVLLSLEARYASGKARAQHDGRTINKG